jgi:tRNA A37 N6-isopentenylltransferase MiaA
VQENRRYARRQLIWFRKEPNLQWIYAAGERAQTQDEVARALAAQLETDGAQLLDRSRETSSDAPDT